MKEEQIGYNINYTQDKNDQLHISNGDLFSVDSFNNTLKYPPFKKGYLRDNFDDGKVKTPRSKKRMNSMS